MKFEKFLREILLSIINENFPTLCLAFQLKIFQLHVWSKLKQYYRR